MENKSNMWQKTSVKFFSISLLALLMLIPLTLIRFQVEDRSSYHNESVYDITKNWGTAQTFSGPSIFWHKTTDKETIADDLYPDSLKYVVSTVSKELHRSIFDVSVYTADITIQGDFALDAKTLEADRTELVLNISDLKGIQGVPTLAVGGKELKVRSRAKGIEAELTLDKGLKEGDVLPFLITMKVNGSESLSFKPVGSLTEVEITSDYPDPSFNGDFLPVERNVRTDGFTAKWLISQITMASPSENSFGVRLMNPVTQYRETERATKYGLLIILLVFVAGFVVEMISKKPINIIQYLVIGASLVLFYSLLLAFSDFLAFGLSYLIAAVMTTAALGAYFIGIVKNKWAYVLTALVALAYGVIYILLQMETFAFLTGTLLLFIILCVIMALTRNMKTEPSPTPSPAPCE